MPSYTLTEIAIEMLGYKLYDADGQFQVMNFGQTPGPPSQWTAYMNEPSLTELIYGQHTPTSPNEATTNRATNNKVASVPTTSLERTVAPEESGTLNAKESKKVLIDEKMNVPSQTEASVPQQNGKKPSANEAVLQKCPADKAKINKPSAPATNHKRTIPPKVFEIPHDKETKKVIIGASVPQQNRKTPSANEVAIRKCLENKANINKLSTPAAIRKTIIPQKILGNSNSKETKKVIIGTSVPQQNRKTPSANEVVIQKCLDDEKTKGLHNAISVNNSRKDVEDEQLCMRSDPSAHIPPILRKI